MTDWAFPESEQVGRGPPFLTLGLRELMLRPTQDVGAPSSSDFGKGRRGTSEISWILQKLEARRNAPILQSGSRFPHP